MGLAFEQQDGESDKAYGAFSAYLNLGPERSLGKAAKATGRTRNQLAKWSKRWRWRRRTEAHTAHFGAVERRSTEALVAEKSQDWLQMHESARRQAWQEGEELIALAREFKARWQDSDRLPEFGVVLRALELAFKLKQFAAGMPSEIKTVNTTVSGPGGGPVMVEFEADVRRIYGAAKAAVVDIESSPITPPASLAAGTLRAQPEESAATGAGEKPAPGSEIQNPEP
jgi:hypothetical protein